MLYCSYRVTKPQMNSGRDLDLSGSRDVMGHVAIQLTVGGFLYNDPLTTTRHLQLFSRYKDFPQEISGNFPTYLPYSLPYGD